MAPTRDPFVARVYQRKYKLLRGRNPKAKLHDVVATAEGVSFRIDAGQRVPTPIEYTHAAALAADIAVLQDALTAWDHMSVHQRTRDAMQIKKGATTTVHANQYREGRPGGSDPIYQELLYRVRWLQIAVIRLLKEEAQMAKTLDDVQADVAANTDVTNSAVTLLGNLKQMLQDAINSGDPAKVQAIADGLEANSANLAAAITANTPAAPPQP